MPAKVNTATLIRGEVYSLRHPKSTAANPKEALRFSYGVPVTIDDKDVLDILEDLTDETVDGDGEVFDKPIFRIDRGVAAPDDRSKPKRTRLAADRQMKRKRPMRRAQ